MKCPISCRPMLERPLSREEEEEEEEEENVRQVHREDWRAEQCTIIHL